MPRVLFALTLLLAACSAPVQESYTAKKAPAGPPPVIQAQLNTDLSQFSIRYFTPVTREAEAPQLADDGTPFTLVEVSPEGEVPDDAKRPSVVLSFSQSVVPLAQVGGASPEGFATVEPPLPGTWRWLGTRVLAFEPSADLADQTDYQVKVKGGLKSLQGKALTGRDTFRFHGVALRLTGLAVPSATDLDEVPPTAAQTVTLTFNTAVEAAVGGALQVLVAGKPAVATSRRGAEANQLVLQLASLPPEDAEVEVVLPAGTRPQAGAPATEQPSSRSFHTLTPFVAYTEELDESWSLEFSHPIDPATALTALHVVPDIGLKADNVRVYGSTLRLVGLNVRADSDYTVLVDPSLQDKFGRALGQRLKFTLRAGPPERYAVFPDQEAHMLEKGSPSKVVWEGQNLDEGTQFVQVSTEPYAPPNGFRSPLDVSGFLPNVRHLSTVPFGNLLNPNGTGWVEMGWSINLHERSGESQRTWLSVQVTDLGLTLRYGSNRIVAWVTSLSTGQSVAGAKVTLQTWDAQASRAENRKAQTTDAQGLAVFELNRGDYTRWFGLQRDGWVADGLRVAVEAPGDRIVFVPNWSHNAWTAGVQVGEGPLQAEVRQPRTFVFTDRQLYRPGETVTWRALDKDLETGTYRSWQGAWRMLLTGDDEKAIATATGKSTSSGGSSGSLAIPADLKPGDYSLAYQRPSTAKGSGGWETTTTEAVVVNNFRKLLFTVTATTPSVPLVLGDQLKVKLAADYLSGGVVAAGALEDYWTREPASFRAVGSLYEGWAFGPPPLDSRTTLSEGKATLSGGGTYEVKHASLAEGVLGLPYVYQYQATVTDPASHQSAATSARLLVHPADFYLGIKLGGQNLDADSGWLAFLPQGQEAKLDVVVVKPDGTPFSAAGFTPAVTAEFVRHDWAQVDQQATGGNLETRWVETLVTVATQPLTLTGATASLSWKPDRAGEYSVEVRSHDKVGRAVVTRKDVYVTGAEWVNWANDSADSLALTPERALYQPGQTARVIVRSPLPKGKYLVTVEREGVFDQRVVELTSASSVIEVPIKPEYLPVVYVSVASFTQRAGKLTHAYGSPDLDKPHALYGVAALKIDSESRRIDLEIVSDQAVYAPAAKATVTIKATHQGKPLADAEVTFLAVDRGVVDLIDYHVPDPLAYFYDPSFFPLMVRGADSRSLLIDPVNYVLRDQPGGAGDDGKLSERKDFQPTAVFEPALKTNAQGVATVAFKLPDSLTTYRTTAFAVKDDLYGLSEGNLAVRQALNVKAVLPRKLRERDTTFSGVMVTNLDSAAQKVTIDAQSDLLTVDKEASKTVTVAGGQTVEVAFQLAAPRAGAGKVTFTVHSALVNEKLTEAVLVERPVVYEAVATLGKLTTGKTGTDITEEALVIPSAAPDGLGTLTLTLDATRIASLGSSMRYLFDYPYGCLEQRSSKLLPIVLFGKYLPGYAAGWGLPGLDPQAVLDGELKVFAASQLPDGGFPLWPNGRREQPYVTLRIAHILLLARQASLEVGTSIKLDALLARVRLLTAATKSDELLAYGLYLQSLAAGAGLAGVGKAEVALRLDEAFHRWNSATSTPAAAGTFALGGLAYQALGNTSRAQQVLDRLKGFLKPDARSVEIDVRRLRTRGEDPDTFTGSTVETYALVLLLFHQLTPESDMNQRLLNALVDRQTNGVWGSTVDNYWALQAFGQVLAAEETQAPAYDAQVSVGTGAGSSPAVLFTHRFEGVRADTQTVALGFLSDTLKDLPRDKSLPLRLEKTGPGTLFYTAELRYALPSELARPIDRGLEVVTQVTDIDGTPVFGNTLTVGKVYRMRALVSTGKTRTQVGLRLAVPSGAEILDARFTPSVHDADNGDVETFLFDNEVQYVFPVFQAGNRQVEFLFRAVNQGVYPTPGASTEAMYTPEVFGRDLGRLYLLKTP